MTQGHSSTSNSNKRRRYKNIKIILGLAIFLLCMFPIFKIMGEKYSKASENNTINYFTQSRFNDFYDLPKNSLDMVFIGSSHSYCTFDPENFDSELNISSFQMGTPLQHPDTSYFLLKEILNYQKPKVVVMETYWDVMDDDFEMKQANTFFEVLKNDDLKKKYINEVFPLSEKVKYNILPIRYQQDYFAYEAENMRKDIEKKYDVTKKKAESQIGKEEYRSKGYVYCDMNMTEDEYNVTNQFKSLDGKDWVFSTSQKKYIEYIIELCNKNDIKLILVTAPIANVSMEFIKNYDAIHNQISDFANQNSIEYIDYNIVNKNESLLSNDNFRDDAHMNDSGVKIVNKHFLNFLKSKVFLKS